LLQGVRGDRRPCTQRRLYINRGGELVFIPVLDR